MVRTITPGTLTEDTLLESRRNNYLAALAEARGTWASLGLICPPAIFNCNRSQEPLPAALARLEPGELLVSDGLAKRKNLRDTLQSWGAQTTLLPSSRFDSANGGARLRTVFGVKTLDGFGAFSRAEISAGGALIDYLELTQRADYHAFPHPGA